MRFPKRRKTKRGYWLMKNKEKVLDMMKDAIESGVFRPGRVHEFVVCEHGKPRHIHSISLQNRMVLNAVMNVVERYIQPTYIADTAASIKNRGMHYLHERFRKNMLNDPCGTCYTYKCDIRKFYESIPQDKMWEVTQRYIKDKTILSLLHGCIFFLPEGLSIGLRTSQCLANLYLSHYVDHVMKERIRVKYYYRYCDDIIMQAATKEELTRYIEVLRGCVANAGLEIKSNDQFWETDKRAVDFIGYLTNTDGSVRLRKKIKQRFARKWRRVKSNRRRRELIGSFFGLAKHATARNLFRTITKIDMNTFATLGLRYADKEGRQYFEVPYHPISDLQNMPIILDELITDCQTKNGKRHIVRYHTHDGAEGKFMTGSDELKYYLEQMREQDLFPVETVIVRRNLGQGKFKYIFT